MKATLFRLTAFHALGKKQSKEAAQVLREKEAHLLLILDLCTR
jgi:hypothetical protein